MVFEGLKRSWLERELVDAKDKLAYHKGEVEHFEVKVKNVSAALEKLGVKPEDQP